MSYPNDEARQRHNATKRQRYRATHPATVQCGALNSEGEPCRKRFLPGRGCPHHSAPGERQGRHRSLNLTDGTITARQLAYAAQEYDECALDGMLTTAAEFVYWLRPEISGTREHADLAAEREDRRLAASSKPRGEAA